MPQRFSRARPSPRYAGLLAQYREMHVDGERHLGIPPYLTHAPSFARPAARFDHRFRFANVACVPAVPGVLYEFRVVEGAAPRGRRETVRDAAS